MKQGINLLKARQIDYSKHIDDLEEEFGLKLPIQYKQFAILFELGKDLIEYDEYFVEKYNDYYYCSYYRYPSNKDFELNSFLSIEKVFEDWSTKGGYSTQDINNNYIKIASINRGGFILIGNNPNDKDKVILNVWDYNPNNRILEINVFDFARKLIKYTGPEADLIEGITYSQLNKNWGDEYWKVRPKVV